MGYMKNGRWSLAEPERASKQGRFIREQSKFRNWITPDGSPGPSGEGGFKAEAGRYHLYIARSCPWAHRTVIFRKLKGLEEMIGLSAVNPVADDHGWSFEDGHGVIPDTVNDAHYYYEIYAKAKPDYTGRCTVPMLWDKKRETIVNNESAEIIRMFNSAFDEAGAKEGDYYPRALRSEIDEINEITYKGVNNCVYRTGFAKTQEAYEEACTELFETLDFLEDRLSAQRFLVDDRLSEADWRLFPTLVRFDAAYYGHFKCNKRRLVDYPNLWSYVRELYQMPGIAGTVDIRAIKEHYYAIGENRITRGIVPLGPDIDFNEEPTRA